MPRTGFRATAYSSPDFAITAMGLTPDEGRQQVKNLFELKETHGSEIAPLAVSFGTIRGWKCRVWRNRLCYVLFPGDGAVLIHVDPKEGNSVDEAAFEAQLHTLAME